MITKYKAFMQKIEKVVILKETEKTVTIQLSGGGTRREAKTSEYSCYRDTFEEAKRYIVDNERAKLKSAKKSVEYQQSMLDKALALEE